MHTLEEIRDWANGLQPLKQSDLEESALCDSWGVFDLSPLNGEVHTVPVYKNGKVRYKHVLGTLCKCKPSIEKNGGILLVVHQDIWG